MKTFILSDSGRILALAFGVALAGSGAGKLLDGTAAIAAGSISVLFAIVFAVVALATAVREHFSAAIFVIVLLPWLALLGEVGVGLMPRSGAAMLLVLGLAAFAFAMRRRTAPERHPGELAVTQST